MARKLIYILLFVILNYQIILAKPVLKKETVDFAPYSNGTYIGPVSPDSRRFFSFINDGNFPYVHRSDDGGLSWYQTWSDDYVWGKDSTGKDTIIHTPQKFSCADCPDTNYCIAYTYNQMSNTYELVTSTDGGFKWSFKKINLPKPFYKLRMFNKQRGIALSSDKLVFTTSDSGKTWQIISDSIGFYGGNSFLSDFEIINSNYVFFYSYISNDGYFNFFKSSDYGITWEKDTIPTRVESMSFVDTQSSWLTVRRKSSDIYYFLEIYRTTDGGKNWELKFVDSLFRGIKSLGAWDSQHAIATSDSNAYITTDGGNTWNIYDCLIRTSGPMKIIALNNHTWLAVDKAAGTIYRLTLESDDVNEVNKENKYLTAYPNPFNEKIRVAFSEENQSETSLIIYDLQGNKLLNITLPMNTKYFDIDMSAFSKGIYLMRLIQGKGVRVEKLVKY